jgi:hypothetical protein
MNMRNVLLGIVGFITYCISFISLIFGGGFQAGYLAIVFNGRLPIYLVIAPCMFPALTVYTATFFKVLIFPPRFFRRCLIVSICWVVALCCVPPILYGLGWLPSFRAGRDPAIVLSLLQVGWLELIPLVFLYRNLREPKSDSTDNVKL